MKKLSYFLVGLIAFSTISCSDEDPNINVLPGETVVVNPVLESFTENNFTVIEANADEAIEGNESIEAGTFSWSAAEGQYNGSIQYFIQIAPEGTDFANGVKVFTGGVTDLSKSFTFGDLNNVANRLHKYLIGNGAEGLTFGEDNNLEVRVMAVSQASQNTGYSNTISIVLNPFEVIVVDEPKLFLVGAPQQYYGLNQWDNATAMPMRYIGNGTTQVFEAFVKVGAGEGFKLIGKQGSWDDGNYGTIANAQDGNLENSGGSGDIKISEVDGEGLYYIQVDLDAMTYKAVKSNWGIIGSATPGDWSSETAMAYNFGTNEFSISINLIDGAMKFRSENTGVFIENNAWKFNVGVSDPLVTYNAASSDFLITTGAYSLTLKINFDCTVEISGL